MAVVRHKFAILIVLHDIINKEYNLGTLFDVTYVGTSVSGRSLSSGDGRFRPTASVRIFFDGLFSNHGQIGKKIGKFFLPTEDWGSVAGTRAAAAGSTGHALEQSFKLLLFVSCA